MSPTIFKDGKYRFHFFSKEESRMHVHVLAPDGEAKYWLEPTIALVEYSGFSSVQLNRLQKIIARRKNEIVKKWQEHFKS